MIGQRLYQKLIKRMLDCIFASLLLVIFSLPMIVIAGTIWLVTHENQSLNKLDSAVIVSRLKFINFEQWLGQHHWFRIRIFIIGMPT